jgi:hypothetical protein
MILVIGIPFVVTFTIIWSSVLDFSYCMLLGCPWLRDVKMSHDWGNNTITIQGTSTIITVHVTKKLGAPTKHPKLLVCLDFHFGISDKEKDLMFATKLGLFSIGTIDVFIVVMLKQHVTLIASTCLNIVEHVFIYVEPDTYFVLYTC